MAAVAFLGVAAPIAAQPPGEAQDGEHLTGQLLVATPDMPDPRFAKTVIFMVKHDDGGAMGLVVNRVVAAGPIADLLKGFGVDGEGIRGNIRVLYGGPVQPYFGFVLHSTDYVNDATMVVNRAYALTSELEILRDISDGDGPRQSLFAMGYAGWGPGQLENEIARTDWYVAPAEPDILFDDDFDTKWERAIALSGLDL